MEGMLKDFKIQRQSKLGECKGITLWRRWVWPYVVIFTIVIFPHKAIPISLTQSTHWVHLIALSLILVFVAICLPIEPIQEVL